MQNCLKDEQMQTLLNCMATCRACAKLCIDEGHKVTAVICGKCADVCELAIKFKCCNSEFSHQVMGLCVQICKKCSAECEKMQAAQCKECCVVCRQCAACCAG